MDTRQTLFTAVFAVLAALGPLAASTTSAAAVTALTPHAEAKKPVLFRPQRWCDVNTARSLYCKTAHSPAVKRTTSTSPRVGRH